MIWKMATSRLLFYHRRLSASNSKHFCLSFGFQLPSHYTTHFQLFAAAFSIQNERSFEKQKVMKFQNQVLSPNAQNVDIPKPRSNKVKSNKHWNGNAVGKLFNKVHISQLVITSELLSKLVNKCDENGATTADDDPDANHWVFIQQAIFNQAANSPSLTWF